MQDDIERTAISIIVVFGALTIGGLMAASLSFGQRDAFLFALGSATAAWLAGCAMIFAPPRVFGATILLAIAMAVASAITLIA